ncbi:condensin-2 complex subunit H2 [Centroberyx gerrardi]|uniref:condensin-2 complex subunit H2 n=1 Tax=Centroberyx gerrardi TaxID=166262 RepID=UPI003AAF984D
MESRENRFAHLLQPIRELTKNWDIDVASELNDYLEELDGMCITFDGGRIKLNFAEAALVIQGSTCIYSKKVELLYSLVYQTLDYINDRNKKRDKQAAGSQENDEEGATTHHDADDGAVFIPLDSSVIEKSQEADSNTSVHVAPLPPESLILPETHEKQKLPLISVKSEILGSHKDFRINTFIPGDQDLILLILGSAFSDLLENNEHTNGPADISLPQQQDAVAQEAVDAGECVANVDEGGDSGGEDNFLPIEDNDVEMDHGPDEHIDRHQAPSEGRMLRERRDVDADKQRREEEKTHAANVWRLHDPYAVFAEDKPLKTGKCYKVPEGLDDGGKRKRKRPSSLQDFRSWFMGIFDPPEHKLKNGPMFTDLNYIYLSTMKEKLKTRKRIFRKAGLVISDEELKRTFLQPEVEQRLEELLEQLRHPDLQGEDNSDNEHEPFPDDIPAEFGGGQDFISPEAQRDGLSYEDLVKKSVEQFLVNSRGYAKETALSRRVKDWEDKIRPELAMQEERPAFDIHDYGDRIVGALNGVGSRKSFASIVHGLDNFEACKYMLASLQLANDYTVEIDSAEGLEELEESLDTMGLTLLSTHRATERFKTLQASAAVTST